jgi:hypothetical protein
VKTRGPPLETIAAWPTKSSARMRSLAVAIIAGGALLRVAQYAANRSLWLDEASLALNVLRRSPAELLLGTLDDNQAAPLGVLALLKLSTLLLGPSEYALRLWPLVAGLLTLPLFWMLARRLLEPPAALLSLALFALSDALIYYASETKQYSSDVLCALLAYLTVGSLARLTPSWRETLRAAVVGAGLIWLSHPVVFVLAGLGLVLTVEQLGSRDRRRLGHTVAVGAVWALSLVGAYLVTLGKIASSSALQSHWQATFMPWPPTTPTGLIWLARTGAVAFIRPFGLMVQDHPSVANVGYAAVPALFSLIGAMGLARRDFRMLALLAVPALLALVASALQRYPIHGRFLLFLAPNVMLLIGAGALLLWRRTAASRPLVGRAALLLLLVPPLVAAAYRLAVPRTVEEVRPLLASLQTSRAPSDRLYLNFAARSAVDYYAMTRYPALSDSKLLPFACRAGASPAELSGPTERSGVWLVFSHVIPSDGESTEQCWVDRLDAIAAQTDALQAPGASAYRYQPR